MKAMILAAGKGQRMRPLTDVTPKPLLIVNGQPLIVYHLQSLAKIGIKEVMINTHYLGEQIIQKIGNGERFGLKIEYSIEEQLLDTGGGIYKALQFLGPEPFLVVSADIHTDFPLHTLPPYPNSLAHLVMVDNPYYLPDGDFSLDKGIVKSKAPGMATFTYGNIGIYRPEFFAHAPQGAFPLGQLLRQHIADGLITGQYYSGSWHNIGTPADLELVNNTA